MSTNAEKNLIFTLMMVVGLYFNINELIDVLNSLKISARKFIINFDKKIKKSVAIIKYTWYYK